MTTKISFREKIATNPVVLKELRGRMRGNRAFIILTGYIALMSAFLERAAAQAGPGPSGAPLQDCHPRG